MSTVFNHYAHTGSGQTIGMYDIFSKGAKGGVFYETEKGWLCCGDMLRQINGTVTFRVWHDDPITKDIQDGVKIGQPFKLLVYDQQEWFEVVPTKVRLAFGGDKPFTPSMFKAKAWNMMAVMRKEYIKVIPSNIIPIEP